MTQYDRLMSGKATAAEIALEIKASVARSQAKPAYTKIPGHVLVEDFLAPYYPADLSDLAKRAKIPYRRLQNLIRGADRIDERMAKSLGDFYGNGSDYWLSLQEHYERGGKL